METLAIEQIKENLWALDEMGSTTMFVYKGSDRTLLLDTGLGSADLKKTVKNLSGDAPIIVVNTHAHPDHNGGNNQIEEVYCGKWDEPSNQTKVSKKQKELTYNHMFKGKWGKIVNINQWNPGPCKKIVPLEEDDIISLGDIRLQVIEIPGHSPGSIALFDKENRLIFTGDTVLTWEVWGHLASSMILRYYAQTLKKLASFQKSVDMVLPSHGLRGNPYGYQTYWMPPEILPIFAQGAQNIIDGKLESSDIQTFAGNGKAVEFEVGGMVYDPERI